MYRRRFKRVLMDTHVPETVPRCYAKRVCCKKCHPLLMHSELNVPPMELVIYLSVWSRVVSSQLRLHETIDYSVSNCFMNIKMKSNIINVETSIRHAAFVSGRLLRFHIPTFQLIIVTCWCLLPSDLDIWKETSAYLDTPFWFGYNTSFLTNYDYDRIVNM